MDYQPPLDDYRFLFHQYLADRGLNSFAPWQDLEAELIDQVLEEAGKLAKDVIAPLNQSGDSEGCIFENGAVRTPTGFKDAYDQFSGAGWGGLTAREEDGGQNLPTSLGNAVSEMMCAANMSFATYPGLTHGAYEALHLHANEALQQACLPHMASGAWSGAMCLTEPHSGTDLGLVRAKAAVDKTAKDKLGQRYLLTGTKIFITAGEHDLTDNILYLTLARLPDAPAGIRGISLFLVPKFVIDGTDKLGARNGVSCASIEHKMGLKASATCVMNFDNALGWLVGEPHKGMKAMFAMMNNARLGVGLQGIAICERAAQSGASYAMERRQGRALTGPQDEASKADPIMVHPDVRRMVLTMRCQAEGCRALGLEIARSLDILRVSDDEAQKEWAEDYVALMTPIAKAMFTDFGLDSANLAVQVWGGHGYIQDNGVEQLVRDIRIALLYEGTNGIQALDLIGRKLPAHGGRLLKTFFHPLYEYVQAKADDEDMAEFITPLSKAFASLQQATGFIAMAGLKDPQEAAAMASDYLRMFGLTALAFTWTKKAEIALNITNGKAQPLEGISPDFYRRKLNLARFFMAKLLPEAGMCFKKMQSGAGPVMALEAELI